MDLLNDTNLTEQKFSEETKFNFGSLTQWLNISAIIGFIGLAVTLLSMVIGKGSGGKENSLAVNIVVIGVSLFINITLFAAAKNLKLGLDNNDQGYFNLGLAKLATYFKIIGIILLIVLIIFGIAIVGSIIFSAFKH